MASMVFTNGHVTINSVDLSAYVRSVTVNYEAEMIDETAMSATTRINKGGLKVWSMDVVFKQDFAASAPDVSLFSLIGSTFTVTVRPVATAVSATNPNYTGTGIGATYSPVQNSVGELAETSFRIESAGALSRATS